MFRGLKGAKESCSVDSSAKAMRTSGTRSVGLSVLRCGTHPACAGLYQLRPQPLVGSGVLERILVKERSSCVARHSLHSRAYRARDIQSYPNKSYAALRARPPTPTGRRPLRPLEGRVRVTAAVLSGSTPLALPPRKLRDHPRATQGSPAWILARTQVISRRR